MRHIKFRTFSKSRGMIDLNATTGRATIVMWPIMRACEYDKNEKQVDMPLMQYTGLKDKNGVEIYENDIVKHRNGIKVVTYQESHAAFDMEISSCVVDQECGAYDESEIEVIGNIHQHPELIKGE